MANAVTMTAETRGGAGKGAARSTRRAGKVPAVIYGAGFYGSYTVSNLQHQQALRAFVDQNPYLQGASVAGKPVIALRDIPQEVELVYLAVNPVIADEVRHTVEAAFPNRPLKEALDAVLKVAGLLEFYPLERARILGLPDPAYEADLRLVVRALADGQIGPADLSRVASIRELAVLVRLLKEKLPQAPPEPTRQPPTPRPSAQPQVFVLPPLEAKPRVLKRAVRDLGRLLARASRHLNARRIRQDPELVQAAERLYEAATSFLRKVVPEASEPAEAPGQVQGVEERPNDREKGEASSFPAPDPAPFPPKEPEGQRGLASLPPEARQELLEELLREESDFRYD